MKKLILFIILILLVGCKTTYHYITDYSYFIQETTSPQYTIDSLLAEKSSDYKDWPSMQNIGVYRGDSTIITTYLNWIELCDTIANNMSVIEYNNTDTCTVKSKIIISTLYE